MNQSTSSSYLDELGSSSGEILNVRREVAKRRSGMSAAIEEVGHVLSHPAFFIVMLAFHLIWIVLNLPIYPWYDPWDPYPFVFLATIASVEAPFIALMVLMHQHRNQRISELREETHLQASLQIEREVTMALRLLDRRRQEDDAKSREDFEMLDQMEGDIDPQRLMEDVRRDLRDTEGDESGTAP